MKKVLSVILCLMLLVSTVSVAVTAAGDGTTYYIDSSAGNDDNSGKSEDSAWKTLGKASSVTYKAGDRILLKSGEIFDGQFIAMGNGTKDNPIVLGAYGDKALGKPLVRSNTDDITLVTISNVSGWTVDGLDFTVPKGRAVLLRAGEGVISEYLTVKNCSFRDILYVPGLQYYSSYAPVLIAGEGETARLRHLSVTDCDFSHCGYGIAMSGLSREWSPEVYKTPEESYNSDFLIEGITMNDILYDGIIIMSVYGMVIRNCSLINVSMDTTGPTAPMWSHHADSFVIENCEIAGSANPCDGMAVDFDGWTTNATYQYIYSHDNQRFVNNCCYDNYTKNENCTVRYCLSVNDNKCRSSMAQILTSGSHEYEEDEEAIYMDSFKFYNNTLVNIGEIEIKNLRNSLIANNIFVGSLGSIFVFTQKNINDKTGEPQINDFSGTFSNNCFCGMSIPLHAENNFICEPGFADTDENNKNSFKLSSGSELIGKGIKAEDDMGITDFYGNALTDSHNIGCYEGKGESGKAHLNVFNAVKHALCFVLNSIYGFIDNCNRRYWIF